MSEPGRNPYKVVPSFWAKDANENYVTVPYPPDDQLSVNFDRILNCQPPLAEWEDHHAVVEREAGKPFLSFGIDEDQSSSQSDL